MPDGSSASLSSEDGSSFLAIKERAIELKALFESHGLDTRRSPSLTKLIEDSIALSDDWFCRRIKEPTIPIMLSAIQLDRVATSVQSAKSDPRIREALEALLDGSINILDNHRTKAKDTQWELDVYYLLKLHGLKVKLDEPDITVDIDGDSVGIACKKFYSESNVSKVTSEAVKQIERTGGAGIVAMNLDAIVVHEIPMRARAIEDISQTLASRNEEFLNRHQGTMRRYLPSGRALSALVSSAALGDVENSKRRFYNARQTTVWFTPSLPDDKERKMGIIYAAFKEQYPA